MTASRIISRYFALLVLTASALCAQQPQSPAAEVRESLDEAWWTGPMLAASAGTLPRGHFLLEPYFYDVSTQGVFDHNGIRRSTTHVNGFGSLTYMIYGIADRVSVGMIPIAGVNTVSGGPTSSQLRAGDLSLQGQYRLTQFHPGHWTPTMSVVVQETLPTGKYDHLGNHPSDGMGSGAYTTTLAVYSQTYFWLPNGRIVRGRLDISQSFSNRPKVEDVSVYGTETGFRGHAKPGSSLFVDLAGEYSLTSHWVLALDVTFRHAANTRVTGYNILDAAGPSAIRLDSGSSEAFGVAPAIEYNFTHNLGVLLGTRIIPAGRNTTATITPALAINFVH